MRTRLGNLRFLCRLYDRFRSLESVYVFHEWRLILAGAPELRLQTITLVWLYNISSLLTAH